MSVFIFNLLSFICVILVVVFFHEFGHYITAKIFGVKVEEFSIGFGKTLMSKRDKSGTKWKIALLPLGGYVKMFGDYGPASNPDIDKLKNMTDIEKNQSFHFKKLYQKFLIVAAGPIANFLLSFLVITLLLFSYGKSYYPPQIANVMIDSPAYNAGIKTDDVILAVDGKEINDFMGLYRVVAASPGKELIITIKRYEDIYDVKLITEQHQITTDNGEKYIIGKIGVEAYPPQHKQYGLFDAGLFGAKETYNMATMILTSLKDMIVKQEGIENLGGPIKVAKFSGDSARQGVPVFLWFIAILSINLGLINLLPIPLLDGGHLLYYAIEGIFGKPLSEKIQKVGFSLGIAFILIVFIFSTINDIKSINIFN